MGIREICSTHQTPSQCEEELHEIYSSLYTEKIRSGYDFGDAFTISDIWSVIVTTYHYPGNFLIKMVSNNIGLHDFFEMSADSFTGWTSGILSAPVWLLVLAIIGSDFD